MEEGLRIGRVKRTAQVRKLVGLGNNTEVQRGNCDSIEVADWLAGALSSYESQVWLIQLQPKACL